MKNSLNKPGRPSLNKPAVSVKIYEGDLRHFQNEKEKTGKPIIEQISEMVRGFTGLLDIKGKQICNGDIIVPLYVTPFGDLTKELDYDNKGIVVFENGCFSLKRKERNNIMLSTFLRYKEGEYISNYGNLIIAESNIANVEIITPQIIDEMARERK